MTPSEPDPDDPRLRLRCYIAGQLVKEAWLDASNPDADEIFARVLRSHMELAEKAENLGVVWMVETYDPALPTEKAYQRIGTDSNGMIAPRPLRPGEL